MLLDMLKTVDAAAQHAHEYSPSRPSSPAPNSSYNGSFLLTQMPLSILSSVMRKQSPAVEENASNDTATTGTVNASTLAASSTSTTSTTSTDDTTTDTTTSTASSTSTCTATAPAYPLHMLPSNLVHSPASSRPASTSSITTASTSAKTRRRAHKPKTTYNLAQPPPTSALHLRPKVLLQLHQVVHARRPKPVYEVIPFSLLAPRSTRRLARACSKDKLGPNDLLVVKAEEYEQKEDRQKSDDERWGTRDVIGIICPAKKADKDVYDKTQVLMEDGSSWDVTYMSNGGYEFNYTDHHGLNLQSRWVPKRPHARRTSGVSSSSLSQGPFSQGADDRKFNFSTIGANTRRHPVIASMTRSSIDILDFYTMPSATTPSTPKSALTPLVDSASFMETPNDSLTVKTDESLRRFITVSGIWVALCENWSAAYSSKTNCPYNLVTAASRSSVPGRAVSMSFLENPRSVSPVSNSDENNKPAPRLFRSRSSKSHCNPGLVLSSSAPDSDRPSSSSSRRSKTHPRRSNSTGNSGLLPRNGSVRRRTGVAFEDQVLAEAEEERQNKRSGEVTRIRELAVPDSSLAETATTPTAPNPMTTQVNFVEPRTDSRSPSPDFSIRKTQSVYEPVTTAGLWDSGVIDDSGPKRRPTSLFVINRRKEKAEKKSKSKERKTDKELEKERKKQMKQTKRKKTQKPRRLKRLILGIFRRETF